MAKWDHLTNSEVEILAVLWHRGPSTVREVFEGLPPGHERGYTTVLKLMQLMFEKGLVERNEDARAHVYTAAIEADRGRQGIVRDVVARLFGGSAKALALNALGSEFDEKQLAEVERVLSEMEEKR